MATKQEWYLARDGGAEDDIGLCVISSYPLHNVDKTIGGANWASKAPLKGEYDIITYRLFSLFTDGKYELRPGAKPRKVLLTPLGVKEVK